MKRADILQTAMMAITQDRQATHGTPENSFQRIAYFWSAYTGVPLDTHDVAAMMALLKIARVRNNPGHTDNWIDLAGYAACGGECATEGDAP